MKMKTEKYRPLKISGCRKTRRNVENMKTSPNSLTKAGWVDALRFCLQTDDIHSILKRRGGNGQKRKGKRERWKNGWLGMEEKTQRESEKRERTMKRHCEWGKERRRESARAQRKSDTWLADGQNKPVSDWFFYFYPQHFDFLMIFRFIWFLLWVRILVYFETSGTGSRKFLVQFRSTFYLNFTFSAILTFSSSICSFFLRFIFSSSRSHATPFFHLGLYNFCPELLKSKKEYPFQHFYIQTYSKCPNLLRNDVAR